MCLRVCMRVRVCVCVAHSVSSSEVDSQTTCPGTQQEHKDVRPKDTHTHRI